MIWFYLLGGLFLGWSLGANSAANIFGTAVATRMVKFKVAAIVAAIFVILGAVFSGAGATETLGRLGAVNALAGSFTVAVAAAVAVTWMTRLSIPVSTTQAIVGAIIGWNLFTGRPTDMGSLTKILGAWVASPLLAGVFSFGLFFLAKKTIFRIKIHLVRRDAYNRLGLIVIGAFGAYSLGANNIANVMGVFVPASPFQSMEILGISLSGTQQLFLLGALAIGVGIYTYSDKVMKTVGNDLFKLTPITALIVVLAESVVLFLFASEGLEQWLASHGLPTIPLVPLSSSQAVIGAVLGLALAKGAQGVRYRVFGRIAMGWVMAPVIACVISFIALFFAQNLFEQEVVAEVTQTRKIEILESEFNNSIAKDYPGEITTLTVRMENPPKDVKSGLFP
ncbi:MAG: inorganic phosphate transporter [Candidatus Marinimicrobia bacterium]|nr:inorganic phosphate transporter [Candidatus Neomarinimicrobiota bacterium]MCF7828477.1 inorganic phosphate transporter [Candidatus Neomarinimicrobiota bacterium]MCF7881967.1 inorganic phosphate transporter [Candidatus Neomarinimicrobiota bacterium]